jgi:hypothetical protein
VTSTSNNDHPLRIVAKRSRVEVAPNAFDLKPGIGKMLDLLP